MNPVEEAKIYQVRDNDIVGSEPGHGAEVAESGHQKSGNEVPKEADGENIDL